MTKWVCKEKHSVAAVISSLKLTRRGWLGCESRCGYSMIQCCRSDFVLEVNLSNKAAAVLSLTSRTSAPHLLYSTGRLQGRNHCSSIWKTCKTSRKADQYTSRPALLCLFCLVCLVYLLSLWSVCFVCVVCLFCCCSI